MTRAGTDNYDLTVVDEAYGPHADLYLDVLRVSYLASEEEIQSAFFDRRSELFEILSKLSYDGEEDDIALSQRFFADRRMNAVIMSFRILKDPALRAIYEGERERRIANRPAERADQVTNSNANRSQKGKSPTAVQSFDDPKQQRSLDENILRRQPMQSSTNKSYKQKLSKKSKPSVEISVTSSPKKSRKKKNIDRTSPEKENIDESTVDYSIDHSYLDTENDTLGEGSLTVAGDYESDSVISEKKDTGKKGVFAKIRESKIVKSIVEEVNGAYMDTTSAFDQVLNAFTLQEKEIEAVCGRINKAKRQLSTRK